MRIFAATGRLVVVAAAFYLGAANLFLGTDLADRAINRKPEKLSVQWERAWTVVPGIVHVRGLELRGQNRKIQWSARVDRAALGIRLWALPMKRFALTGARAAGLEFRLRRRWDGLETAPLEPSAWAPIAGLANPPDPRPEVLYPPRPHRRWRWTIDLRDVRIGELREIWIDQYRLRGDGRIAGALRFQIRGALEAPSIRFGWWQGSVGVGEETIADRLEADWHAHIAPFVPRETEGREFLGWFSGRYRLGGRLETLGFLDPYLAGLHGLRAGGEGRLEADLQLEAGSLTPPSRLAVDARRLTIAFLQHVASGAGRVGLSVDAGEPPVSVVLALDRFSLERLGLQAPYAEGSELVLALTAAELALDEGLREVEGVLEMPTAQVPDLSAYDPLLPDSLGLTLSGSGRLSGRVELGGQGERGLRAALDLVSRDLVLTSGERRIPGALEMRTRLRGTGQRLYDLAGSEAQLEVVRASDEEGVIVAAPQPWRGTLVLSEGTLSAAAPLEVRGRVRAELADSGPLVALLAEQKLLVNWFQDALTVRDVVAEAALQVGPGLFALEDLEVAGGELEIRGDLTLQPPPRHGLLFLRLGRLSAGLRLDGEVRDWKLIGSRRWFEEARSARGTGEQY